MKSLRKHTIERLRSERGASLSVVLLLFLVCMAVSSIVLAAATTTSGRQSQLAAMDKRYYNVMSAQELLWSEIKDASYKSEGEDKRIKIERSCVVKRKANGTYELAVDPQWSVSLKDEPLVGAYVPSTHTLLETLAIDTVFPKSAQQSLSATRTLNDAAISETFDNTSLNTSAPQFLPLPQVSGVTKYDAVTTTVKNSTYTSDSNLSKNLKTDVVITPDDNGNLLFSLASATPNDNDTYKMQFKAQVQIDEDSDLARISDDDTYRLTNTTYVSWDPTALEKGSGTS